MVDKFTHPKTNRTSLCFRITYRSMDRCACSTSSSLSFTSVEYLPEAKSDTLNIHIRARTIWLCVCRSLTNEEINELQAKVRDEVPVKLGVELR